MIYKSKDKENMLTYETAHKTFTYDEGSGSLIWAVSPKYSSISVGDKAECRDHAGYLRVMVSGVRVLVHRLVWMMYYGSWPKNFIDHINGIKTDNRICNLRDCTQQQNCQNRTVARRGCRSGVRGVSKNTEDGKWVARVCVRGVNHYLGSFDSVADASLAAAVGRKRLMTHCIEDV